MLRPRSIIALLAAGTIALAGCSSSTSEPSPSASPTASGSASPSAPAVKPSDNLDGIKVSGEPGKEPKVKIPSPWAIDKTQTKVLNPGQGGKLSADGIAVVHYYGVNGRTGQKFDDSFSRGAPATFPLNQVVPGFSKGLTGQQIGSRVLIAMPGADGYDAMGGNLKAGIQVGDTLVFVVDIVDGSLGEASGAAQTLPAGAPTVEVKDGKPAVKIPEGAKAPEKAQLNYLIKGSGAEIKKDSVIGVKYVGYSWKTGKLVEDRFAALDQGELKKTIGGWKDNLPGVPVGSRVQLVVPNAYPKGNPNSGVEAGDTLVYVIDVLYVQK